jgi:hypothetical protein
MGGGALLAGALDPREHAIMLAAPTSIVAANP